MSKETRKQIGMYGALSILALTGMYAGWHLHSKIVEAVKVSEPVIQKVYFDFDTEKVTGDCALIEPPCWYDFAHTLLRIK